MKLRRLHIILSLIAAFYPRAPAHGQVPVEKHDWVLLIDASASLVDGGASNVRNEALVQMQTLLAIASERNPSKPRQDRLIVYRFGDGFDRISLPSGALRWDDINRNVRWSAGMPPKIRGKPHLTDRTDFVAMLDQVKSDFQSRRDATQRHIVLISDGDLDVRPANRTFGAPPAAEEVAAYERFFGGGRDGLLSWFVEQRVTIDTLYVPRPSLSQPTLLPQDIVRKRLDECPGDDPAAKALKLVRSIAERRPCAVGIGSSEGPYILRAIADRTDGRSYTVDTASLVDALRQLVVPDLRNDVGISPGTRILYIFGRHGETTNVEVKDSRGRLERIQLGPADFSRIDPPNPDINIKHINGPGSVIWRIAGDLGQGGPSPGGPTLSLTAFGVEWIKPPASTPINAYVGLEFPIEVSLLLRTGGSQQNASPWDTEQWRKYFSDKRLTSIVSVEGFSSGIQPVVNLERKTGIAGPTSVADFAGKLRGFARPDRYRLRTEIKSDPSENSWVQASDDPVIVEAVPVPDVRVVTVDSNRVRQDVPIRLSPDASKVEPTPLPPGAGLSYQFELWHDSDAPSSVNPAFGLKFRLGRELIDLSARSSEMRQPEERPNRRKAVWRSGLVRLERLAEDALITVEGGAGPLHGIFKVPPPVEMPKLSVQSGLMNAEGGNNCPRERATFFELQQPRDVVLSGEDMPVVTNIVTPFGRSPVCLIFRWLNHSQFQQAPWELKLTSTSPRFERTLRSKDGANDPETGQAWKSDPIEIPREVLDRLGSELKVSTTSYFAQYDEEQLGQDAPVKPFACLKGSTCQQLKPGGTIDMPVHENGPLAMYFELQARGPPGRVFPWQIRAGTEMQGQGNFRIDRLDQSDRTWILRTDENKIPDSEALVSVFLDGVEHAVQVDRGLWWRIRNYLEHHVHLYAALYYLWQILSHGVPALALFSLAATFGLLRKGYHSGRIPREDLNHPAKYPRHLGSEFDIVKNSVWNWLRSKSIPRQFRFMLSGPGNKLQPFEVPKNWGVQTYIVIGDSSFSIAHQLFGKPAGVCLRVSIEPGPVLKLDGADGELTFTIVERGRSGVSFPNAYSIGLDELIGGSKEIDIAVRADPKRPTIRLRYLGLKNKGTAAPQTATAMRQ